MEVVPLCVVSFNHFLFSFCGLLFFDYFSRGRKEVGKIIFCCCCKSLFYNSFLRKVNASSSECYSNSSLVFFSSDFFRHDFEK